MAKKHAKKKKLAKIYEFAQENKVIPVSPNTFYAFLQVIIMGIRNLEIIKKRKKAARRAFNPSKVF